MNRPRAARPMTAQRPTVWKLCLRAVVTVAILSALVPRLSAAYPPYLILRGPAPLAHPHPHHGGHHLHGGHPPRGYRGYAIEAPAQGYAWGYFGAQPRRHWSPSHHGYYSNFTQWSAR